MTVVIDVAEQQPPRYEQGLELFARARRGEVELAIASSGQLFDNPYGAAQELIESGIVTETVQLAYPGVMVPGSNAVPGASVEGFGEAWKAIAADWNGPGRRPEATDALHIETHVLEKRDVFITDDEGLRTMCRRLHDEADIAIEAQISRSI